MFLDTCTGIYLFFTVENISLFRTAINKALEGHVGVLGFTNALHLKLLSIKAMTLQGNDTQKKMYLIELEKHMRWVVKIIRIVKISCYKKQTFRSKRLKFLGIVIINLWYVLCYRSAFGEYYLELHSIYKGLVMITSNAGDFLEASFYYKKVIYTGWNESPWPISKIK